MKGTKTTLQPLHGLIPRPFAYEDRVPESVAGAAELSARSPLVRPRRKTSRRSPKPLGKALGREKRSETLCLRAANIAAFGIHRADLGEVGLAIRRRCARMMKIRIMTAGRNSHSLAGRGRSVSIPVTMKLCSNPALSAGL